MKTYHLILPANPDTAHAAGESAGSTLAHWFHLKKLRDKGVEEPGVMWFWHFQDTGIAEEEKSFFSLKEREEIRLPLTTGKGKRKVRISDIGFIYEGNHRFTPTPSSIAWQFRADRIISPKNVKGCLKDYEAFIPFFRQVYVQGRDRADERWLLIRDMKQLEKPIEKKPKSARTGTLEGFKRFQGNSPRILKTNILQNNVFAMLQKTRQKLKDPDPIKELDRHLKKLLTLRKGEKVDERMVHEAFLLKKFGEGCRIYDEGPVKSGRFDTLLQDKSGKYVAIEFKLGDEGTSADQLKNYIHDIQKNKQNWGIEEEKEIEGEIVCGNPRRKKLDGFKVTEWKLSIQF